MFIHRGGDRPWAAAGTEYFTGTVRFDPVVGRDDPSPTKILSVTFEPGARTAWHTHPAGQTLHIVSGMGLAGSEGQLSECCALETPSGSNPENATGTAPRPTVR